MHECKNCLEPWSNRGNIRGDYCVYCINKKPLGEGKHKGKYPLKSIYNALFLLGPLNCTIVFWLGGFDFNERGFKLVSWFFVG